MIYLYKSLLMTGFETQTSGAGKQPLYQQIQPMT